MRMTTKLLSSAAIVVGLSAFGFGASAADLPGLGSLSGKISVPKAVGQLTVYAWNKEKGVAYMVYVVNGEYRATNMFPGHYEVTLRGTPGQMNWSLPQQSIQIDIAAGKQAKGDIALKDATLKPTYFGGMPYDGWTDREDADPAPVAKVVKYDDAFPQGRGRDIIERICMGCHTPHLFTYNADRTYATGRTAKDKDGWAITVDRMHKGAGFNTPGKAPNFDPDLLPPVERDIIIEYLAKNFGAESEPRAVMQESDPPLDTAALAKAQLIEYRKGNTEDLPKRATHTITFAGDGTIWTLDRGSRGSVIHINPATGQWTDYTGHGGGESITADGDGTVWYGGFRHFDPKTNKHDEYKFDNGKNGRPIGVSTSIFDSNGDQWGTLLGTGGIIKWDRKTDKITWWDVPVYRSRPYGLTLDHNDKVWFAEYHNSGLTRFDPVTNQFRHFRLTPQAPTNMRRPGADSKNMIWMPTWGSYGYNSAALYKLNPETAEVKEYKLTIPFANPYDSEPDDEDNIWLSTDNHLVKFDQKTEKFTNYPVTTRTDIARVSITGEGAIWYASRNAGQSGGYGATATVLYPDKDKIKTLEARVSAKSNNGRLQFKYKGPWTAVTGTTKLVSPEPQNPGAYNKVLEMMGLPVPVTATPGVTRTRADGSAAE